ncbi:hypothetical protein JIG36_35580 [Actinoplanes sp. LDG1-06]|uniref:Uncharacterized protein n=1 Tax=Paractinoplanes ovalisporus TaxID=2810368 RepID=A0ABS2ALW3_9ACTN|nr:hypothetical protein [Actinoplanes ovalisporus]MBM2620835.1 hypothetical protein [Actinoplanes ovalisporus]
MNEFDDRIREGMAEGERLPTDPAVVYNRVQTLSQSYRKRRRIAQSAGSAVLGVGLMAGLVQMHDFLEGGTAPTPPPPSATTALPLPASSASPTPSSIATRTVEAVPGQRELDAFFEAGYDWGDAEKLARLWNFKDPTDAKVEAGRRLLAGRPLPSTRTDLSGCRSRTPAA